MVKKIVYWYRNFWMDVNHGSAHELLEKAKSKEQR